MSLSQLFGRIIHPHHRVKLTPEQEQQQIWQRRNELRKSGVWIGCG
ncbi:MAG: hypothetical protein QG549_279 [Patescibacteria group bacterium]|nr:hypothetical protein [Patescibacteria group bacterium]